MRTWFFALAFLAAFAAGCQPQQQAAGLQIAAYDRALRDAGLHDIRFEKNTRLPPQVQAVAAADVYLAGQHLLICQWAPPKKGEEYRAYFDGYKAQKYTILTNDNLVLVAEPNVQQEILDAFTNLR
jgi:ABC-type nitrate/sulfonate/bicarbonate transport system substrate-binding protein